MYDVRCNIFWKAWRTFCIYKILTAYDRTVLNEKKIWIWLKSRWAVYQKINRNTWQIGTCVWYSAITMQSVSSINPSRTSCAIKERSTTCFLPFSSDVEGTGASGVQFIFAAAVSSGENCTFNQDFYQFASADESADLWTTTEADVGGHDILSDNPLLRKALRQWKRDLNRWMFMVAIREKQRMPRIVRFHGK